ncbi:TetR/AcrR family transcriptional regulator [Gottfriedia acidiceleris]|uniref:TetR/AcrR family transcriptional regulator n=1 Tax=Gottfriedia acidiceleris TaxID=371036 RepID=A0ABY4JNB2_9BACI|nr:TetR/AcrR family transcriptional regulator [Gottfriedia acidiceleris]UPM55336.1 TetR/AcrR family transcriptional regulator [Gottfriedia acidiceleris]
MLPIKLEEFFPKEKLQEMNEKEIKILEAAIEIFAEKGFVSTSTNEIAKKANVAEGTIFRYFKTKKDLLKSIIKPTLVKTIAPFEMDRFSKAVFHLEYETFEDFLNALIKNRMEFAKKNKAAVKIIIQEMPFQDDMQEELKKLFKDKMYPKAATVLQSFIDKGQIKERPIPTILRLIISTVVGLVISSIVLENTPFWNEEQETERTIEFIKNGLK